MGHRLELSTGVVVGFCYHKAADLCVRQAAHSLPCLSCIRSCSAIAVSVNVIKPFAREGRAPNCPLRVWSLTGYELRTHLAIRCFSPLSRVRNKIGLRSQNIGLIRDMESAAGQYLDAIKDLSRALIVFTLWTGGTEDKDCVSFVHHFTAKMRISTSFARVFDDTSHLYAKCCSSNTSRKVYRSDSYCKRIHACEWNNLFVSGMWKSYRATVSQVLQETLFAVPESEQEF